MDDQGIDREGGGSAMPIIETHQWVIACIVFAMSALFFASAVWPPRSPVEWGRRRRRDQPMIPMSTRGKNAMGIYVAYWGMTVLLIKTTASPVLIAGGIVIMIALIPVYLRDKRNQEDFKQP
jgi:hypothetical protein